MSDSPSFQSLLQRIHNGDQQRAAERIVERFAHRLAALTARRIPDRLRHRVEPADVVQSVFAVFFRKHQNGEFELRDWESLWGLLARIAVLRIKKHQERLTAARRDLGRDAETPGNPSWLEVQALDRDPGPDDVLVAQELYDQLLDGLSDRNKLIVARVSAGETYESIARELGTSLSTVERGVRRARERLAELSENC